MSLAVHAKGTILAVGDGVTPTEGFSPIAECKSITGPQFEGATIDVTTHSTSGNYREFKANILDPGSLDFEINFVGTDAQHKMLLNDQAAQTEKNYKLTTKDSTPAVFLLRCQVIRYNFSFPVDNVQTAALSLKVIGPPTLPA
jgi:predicted secreted protein